MPPCGPRPTTTARPRPMSTQGQKLLSGKARSTIHIPKPPVGPRPMTTTSPRRIGKLSTTKSVYNGLVDTPPCEAFTKKEKVVFIPQPPQGPRPANFNCVRKSPQRLRISIEGLHSYQKLDIQVTNNYCQACAMNKEVCFYLSTMMIL